MRKERCRFCPHSSPPEACAGRETAVNKRESVGKAGKASYFCLQLTKRKHVIVMNESLKTNRRPTYAVVAALAFIASGILLLALNLGWISQNIFDLLVAWHTLLIALGCWSLWHRNYSLGLVLLLAGGWLLGGKLELFNIPVTALRGPLLLVLIGIFLLTRRYGKRLSRRERYQQDLKQRIDDRYRNNDTGQVNAQCQPENGFLCSDNSLGAVRRVVLDEIFKGARINNRLGGTCIDLRRTNLGEGDTYIDVECRFGGVELYIPSDWKVRMDCNCLCGECVDKRWKATEPASGKGTLVLRGHIAFGSLEIKD